MCIEVLGTYRLFKECGTQLHQVCPVMARDRALDYHCIMYLYCRKGRFESSNSGKVTDLCTPEGTAAAQGRIAGIAAARAQLLVT